MRVVYAFPTAHLFRKPFHESLREKLARFGIRYDYIYSASDTTSRNDTGRIAWALDAPVYRFPGTSLRYHAVVRNTWDADLVILQQENALLSNYPIQIARRICRRKVAFFGHGKNFQSSAPNGVRESFKRLWTRHADWWFAYTDQSATTVAATGFPRERITVFNNTIDTSAIAAERAQISDYERDTTRLNLLQNSENVAIFLGGLYNQKRLPFLFTAAEHVRLLVPDFQLIIVGDGPQAAMVREYSARHSWIHMVGARYGREKTLLATLSKALLIPGAVGLGVIDSFAYGTPLITTDINYHGPEIEYLVNNQNGICVSPHDDPIRYAESVRDVLVRDALRTTLQEGCRRSLAMYTMEAMTDRFAAGVHGALAA